MTKKLIIICAVIYVICVFIYLRFYIIHSRAGAAFRRQI